MGAAASVETHQALRRREEVVAALGNPEDLPERLTEDQCKEIAGPDLYDPVLFEQAEKEETKKSVTVAREDFLVAITPVKTDFDVTVKTVAGKLFTLNVEPNHTVGSIKERIHEEEGTPPGHQHLIFRERKLVKDHKLLSAVKVVAGCDLLHVVPKTEEELSDEEFEREVVSLGKSTRTVRVRMLGRNSENGDLGGERGACHQTMVPTASATTLPPSALPSGRAHRPPPVPVSFDLRCPRGASFKWLAMVASQRFETETAQAGERRQREHQGSVEKGSHMLPSYVSSNAENDSFYDPRAHVFEGELALEDGAEVWVTLEDHVAVETSNTNAPASSRWFELAFANNRPGRQERAKHLEGEIEVGREKRRREAASRAAQEKLRYKIGAMQRILGDQANYEASEAGLAQHHLMLAGDTMSLFDDEDDVAATVAVLEQNYTALKDVFKSYARSPKGKVMCMSSTEFSKFAVDARCLQPEKIWKLNDIYYDSTVKEAGIRNRSGKFKSPSEQLFVSPDKPVVTQSMDLAGFLASTRNLAFTRFLEETDGKMSPEQIKELGRNKIKGITDAVQVLLNQAVLTLIDKSSMMNLVFQALGEPDVLALYYDNLSKLRGVFEKYAAADGVADTMTLTEFSAAIRDTGLMGMAEAKKVFNLVQQQQEDKGVEQDAAAYDDDNLMTFAEFLSGVARIGMWKYGGAGGSLGLKISKAVEVICSLYSEADVADNGENAESVSDVTGSMHL